MASKLGLTSVTDTMDFMRNAWGNLGLPSSLAPTMDVAELDKRIADLQAVEQWLITNQNILRSTIQGLEVQRNTIATVQALGAHMSTAGSEKSKTKAASAMDHLAGMPTKGGAANLGGIDPNAWWEVLQGQFNQIAQSALGKTATDMATDMVTKAVTQAATNAATKAAKDAAGKVARGAVNAGIDVAKGVAKGVASGVASSVAKGVANRASNKAAGVEASKIAATKAQLALSKSAAPKPARKAKKS
jgi:hypothetical protein